MFHNFFWASIFFLGLHFFFWNTTFKGEWLYFAFLTMLWPHLPQKIKFHNFSYFFSAPIFFGTTCSPSYFSIIFLVLSFFIHPYVRHHPCSHCHIFLPTLGTFFAALAAPASNAAKVLQAYHTSEFAGAYILHH